MKDVYWKLNAICGWIFLLPIDFMLYLTTHEKWSSIRHRSNKAVRNSWNKCNPSNQE